MRSPPIALAFGATLLFACGGGGGTVDAGDDISPPDAASGFAPLVVSDWSLAAGQESYYCVRATVTRDTYIHAFKPIAPHGTHHTALAIDAQGGPDGGFPCAASDTGFKMLFGSGLGTEPYALPDGVAFKLSAGDRVILNLHLYNTTDLPITGHSGVEIQTVPAAEVVHEAEVIYALDSNLVVPSGDSTYTTICMMHGDSTVVGLFPHMHQRGTHMKASLFTTGSGPSVFFDQPYMFGSQRNYPVGPLDVHDGDLVQFQCSFTNDGAPVGFGQSTDDEMCVLGMYRYPPSLSPSICNK